MADSDDTTKRPLKLSFASYDDLLANPKGFASYPDNVINLSDIRQNTVPKLQDDSFYDRLISEPLLDAFSKNENILKDFGSKLDDSIQTLNRFANAAFQSDTFKKVTDSINKTADIFGKNIDTIAQLAENMSLLQKGMERALSLGLTEEQILSLLIKPQDKEQDALGKVRYLINNDDVEALIKTVENHHKRLLCRKVFYLLRVKLNVVNNDKFKPQATFINMDEYMVSCGKNCKDKNYRIEKTREKKRIKEAINILDPKADIKDSRSGLAINISKSFWVRFFSNKSKAQTYVPWLLKINTEIEFIIAEKLIGQYTTLNNSQKKRPNYNCLRYETFFRHKYGDPKRATPDQRYDGNKLIIEAIQSLKDCGYIEYTWYKGKNSLKSARPDNHEEAMGCKLKFTIPAIDEEKLASKRPLPHQLS